MTNRWVARLATPTWMLVLSISLENLQLPSRAAVVIGPWREHVRVMLISVFCEYAHSEGLIVGYVARKSWESSQVAAVG